MQLSGKQLEGLVKVTAAGSFWWQMGLESATPIPNLPHFPDNFLQRVPRALEGQQP